MANGQQCIHKWQLPASDSVGVDPDHPGRLLEGVCSCCGAVKVFDNSWHPLEFQQKPYDMISTGYFGRDEYRAAAFGGGVIRRVIVGGRRRG